MSRLVGSFLRSPSRSFKFDGIAVSAISGSHSSKRDAARFSKREGDSLRAKGMQAVTKKKNRSVDSRGR
jgi:hypothetical protein